MPKISKRTVRKIELVSVFDSVLREKFTVSTGGVSRYFADDRPEMWDSNEREIFDIASEVEYRLKSAILNMFQQQKDDTKETEIACRGSYAAIQNQESG